MRRSAVRAGGLFAVVCATIAGACSTSYAPHEADADAGLGDDAGDDAASPPPPPPAEDSGADAGGDADAGSSFCAAHPKAVLCLDFDETTDASALGVAFTENDASGAIVPMFAKSTPNAFRATVTVADGGAPAYAYLSTTVPFAKDGGLTVATDVEVPTSPTGLPTIAVQLTIGSMIASGEIMTGTPTNVGVFWDCQSGASDSNTISSMTAGAYHTLSISSAANTVHMRIDGAQDLTCALGAAATSATILIGLYFQDPGGQDLTAYFDDVIVTSP
ncbi:MAG TPA: hypothetical protein VIF62_22725 [Labilithrix sp.]